MRRVVVMIIKYQWSNTLKFYLFYSVEAKLSFVLNISIKRSIVRFYFTVQQHGGFRWGPFVNEVEVGLRYVNTNNGETSVRGYSGWVKTVKDC